MFDRYSSALFHYRKMTVFLCLLVSIVLTVGVKDLEITTNFRAFFGNDNPQLAAFESLEDSFTRQDSLVFYIEVIDGTVFQKSTLQLILQLTEKAWELPYSTRVDSISNFQATQVDGDTLIVDDIISGKNPLTPTDLATIQRKVIAEPSLKNSLASENGKVTAIKVTLNMPHEAANENQLVVDKARELINKYRLEHPELILRLLGSVTVNVAMKETAEHDMATLVLASYIIIIGGLIVLLRSFRQAAMTLLIISLSVITTIGFFGWLKFTLTPVAGMVPSAIMTIAIADSIHLIKSYRHEILFTTHQRAVTAALKANIYPILLTSITTIIGVLSLNFSDSPPYQTLGNMVAFGVLIAMILSLTILPALLYLFPERNRRAQQEDSHWASMFSSFIIRYHKVTLSIVLSVIVIFSSFLQRNELNEQWYAYFDQSLEITKSINAFNDKLNGIHHIDYKLTSTSGTIHQHSYLQQVDAYKQWWLEQDNVVTVSSYSTLVKRINQNMHNNDPSWYRIPDNNELAAQYFLLYGLSLPQGLSTDDQVDMQQAATRLSVALRKTDSSELIRLDTLANNWLKNNAKDIKPTTGSSLDIVFAKITEENLKSLLEGAVIALFLISALLVITLKSIKLGLISLIPNLAPAAVAYGIWGLTVGHIDLALSIVVCLSLGIVVDDTVHFLSKYRTARCDGKTAEQAIDYTFRTVGSALLTTTIVLVFGFSILGFSNFSGSSSTGIMMALTLSIALIVDFLVLPPLLLLFDAKTNYTTDAPTITSAIAPHAHYAKGVK